MILETSWFLVSFFIFTTLLKVFQRSLVGKKSSNEHTFRVMRNKHFFFLFMMLFGIAGCGVDELEVEPWQEEQVETFVDKEWTASTFDEGVEWRDIWIFRINATGTHHLIAINEDGTIREEYTDYFKWTFTSLSYDMIYMDDEKYWQIEELTSEKLCVTETLKDPIDYPDVTKVYKEYTAKKEGVKK